MRREKSAENKIRDDDGGEATGAFAVQFSGSSKLVGRRVVPSQGVAASPLPLGATSPRAASPSCTPPRVRIVPSRTSSTAVVVPGTCTSTVLLIIGTIDSSIDDGTYYSSTMLLILIVLVHVVPPTTTTVRYAAENRAFL